MQEIKTVVYKDLELDDKGVNHWLSQGWKVYDLATSVTLNEESEAGNGMTVIRIFTLIRDLPDATFNADGNSGRIVTRPDGSRDVEFDETKAQDAPQEKTTPREYKYKVGDMVRVNVPNHDNDGETGTVIRVDADELCIYPYEVSFTFIESGDDWQETSWHREDDLEDPTEWITKLTPPSGFDPDAIPF